MKKKKKKKNKIGSASNKNNTNNKVEMYVHWLVLTYHDYICTSNWRLR
jgi:hypothetical protein